MTVNGIGGFFFRAKNPEALAAWYRNHLGIGLEPHGVWRQSAGPTVFMPFPEKTDYFPADHAWMMNLRVNDLATTLAALKSVGIGAITKPEWDSPQTGKFARIHDPEGNPIELWQPPA